MIEIVQLLLLIVIMVKVFLAPAKTIVSAPVASVVKPQLQRTVTNTAVAARIASRANR